MSYKVYYTDIYGEVLSCTVNASSMENAAQIVQEDTGAKNINDVITIRT